MAQGGRLFAALTATMLLLAACGGGGGQQGGPPPSPPGATTVTVEETEFAFVPKDMTARAGQVTFEIKNVGAVEHNFIIVGTNVQVEGIQPDQSKSVSVTLKAGTYAVECTIPGHKEAGMVGTLTVTP
jgi:uncharacterized cupredoxin-like copper-binding protein